MKTLTDVKWIVNNGVLEGSLYKNLPEIIRSLGMECKSITEHPLSMDDPYKKLFSIKDCVIPYVTINVARRMKDFFGLYLNEHHLKYHVYTSLMKLDPLLFLNSDAILTTYGNFKARPKEHWFNYFTWFDPKELFIRPDSGIKIFTGCLIPSYNWDGYLTYLDSTSVTDESLIWISSPKTFWDETRFIICNGKVIDGSRYSLGTVDDPDSFNNLVEDKLFPLELWDLAKKIAECKWTPEPIFTADLCMTYNGPKIVEINSFSCAGWYACDPEKVVKEVSEYTLQLYNEQYY